VSPVKYELGFFIPEDDSLHDDHCVFVCVRALLDFSSFSTCRQDSSKGISP
jgi:hypothetical protein